MKPTEGDGAGTPPDPGNRSQDRYCRQSLLPEIGTEGQHRLNDSRVVIVGLGAMGSSAANFLVRAGIGQVVLIDRDLVELHNLQRQILYTEEDINRPKAVSAAEILGKINSSVAVEAHTKDLNVSNAEKFLVGADVILDGTDNLQTRFLINDVCVKHHIPWIYAGAVGTSGMVMPILPGSTPCFRCLIPSLPAPGMLPTCDIAGVLNTIPGLIASLECTLAYEILTGRFEARNETAYLVHIDAWRQTFDRMAVRRRADCPCCGEGQLDFLDAVSREMITSLCGRDAIQITPAAPMEIPLEELEVRLKPLGEVKFTPYMLTFRSGTDELSIFRDGRVIIKGTKDEAAARSLYARYIGL
ncbi:ThiF family adenylyltransferase [Methanoregula sp.]|jgi:molybdopterin-synthase adenylyltransferase|uniref:ThiF family adenylyltransferase n=1 Tax=Methanoregula sp. TaxID=2052170 RepID=UPI003C2819A2